MIETEKTYCPFFVLRSVSVQNLFALETRLDTLRVPFKVHNNRHYSQEQQEIPKLLYLV